MLQKLLPNIKYALIKIDKFKNLLLLPKNIRKLKSGVLGTLCKLDWRKAYEHVIWEVRTQKSTVGFFFFFDI